MKILLTAINSKYIHSNLAVYSLKSYAGDVDVDVKIANFTINNKKEDIIKSIYKEQADVVAFSAYIWNIEYIKSVAGEIKKLCEGVKIWLGGPEVSYNPSEFLEKNEWADVVMFLEGEATFKELLQKDELSEIKGIAYREGDKIIKNPARPLLDMDDIPFPYEDLTEFDNRIIYYESSRGCPYSCSYCLSSVEKRVRFRSLEKVKEELKFFLNEGVSQVKFVDRTFNCNHARTKELLQFISENDNGKTNFHFEISADLIDDEELELIKGMRPGLIQLEIGVQSTNEKTITEIKRSMNLKRLENVVEKIRSFNNTHEHLDLIAGLPYEDYDTFKQSFNDVYAMKPHQLQLGFLKVLKGSYMYNMQKEYGIIYTTYPPYEVQKTNWLTYEEVLKLKNIEEMLEVYYNSGQYVNTLRYLEGFFMTPFEMYYAMARYYEQRNLFGINHSRIMRYNYLYDFALEQDVPKEVLGDIITFDLYLREKLKTRPAFSADIHMYRDTIHRIYNTQFLQYKDTFSHIEPIRINPYTFEAYDTVKYVLFDYENKDELNNHARVIFADETEG